MKSRITKNKKSNKQSTDRQTEGNRRGSSSKNPRKKGQKSRPTDKRLRRLLIPTRRGVREVAIRGSKETSRLGRFWAAVQRYLQTGDDSALRRFKSKTFTDAIGKRYSFPTDLRQLDRQASAGVLSFESIYAGGGR